MNQDEKLWSGLSYVGLLICAIPTIVILLIKKDESATVKFHALQALGFFLASFVINTGLNILNMMVGQLLGPVALLVGAVAILVSLALLGYWIFLTIKAFMGDDIQVPVLSDFIHKYLMKA
ncbi:MAG: DUF4870 domain-containing protein [Vampirovibrionales bacterium]|nr:DUF4870 domain-containing protein [Vampirovibrionales bacterium]